METCKHCGKPIAHHFGRLWHSEGKVFPQYCETTEENQGEQLHEPSENDHVFK